jgi:hypothetical protein
MTSRLTGRWLAWAIITAIFTTGCGAGQLGREGPRGTVRFKGEPADATVSIDETHLGPIGMFEEHGVKLRPGTHRIVVEKEGYFPEYRLVEVARNKLVTLEIKLREVP